MADNPLEDRDTLKAYDLAQQVYGDTLAAMRTAVEAMPDGPAKDRQLKMLEVAERSHEQADTLARQGDHLGAVMITAMANAQMSAIVSQPMHGERQVGVEVFRVDGSTSRVLDGVMGRRRD